MVALPSSSSSSSACGIHLAALFEHVWLIYLQQGIGANVNRFNCWLIWFVRITGFPYLCVCVHRAYYQRFNSHRHAFDIHHHRIAAMYCRSLHIWISVDYRTSYLWSVSDGKQRHITMHTRKRIKIVVKMAGGDATGDVSIVRQFNEFIHYYVFILMHSARTMRQHSNRNRIHTIVQVRNCVYIALAVCHVQTSSLFSELIKSLRKFQRKRKTEMNYKMDRNMESERKEKRNRQTRWYCEFLVNWNSMRNQANESFCNAMTTIRDARSNSPVLVDCDESDLERNVRTHKWMRAQHTHGEWEGTRRVYVCISGNWIGVWLYAMYLISFYYYCYYNIMFIACRCSGCCRRHHHCHTTPSESSVCCTHTNTQMPSHQNASSSLTRAHTPSFTRRKKERNQTQERGIESSGRQESPLPSSRATHNKTNKMRRTWCVLFIALAFLLRSARQSGKAATSRRLWTRPLRQRRKTRPEPTEIYLIQF